MESIYPVGRRTILKTSMQAVLGIPVYNFINKPEFIGATLDQGTIPEHFPNIPPEIINEVVGKSHFDLETVKKLVEKRPELARSVWEWRFGDFESAIGAASHVGRRDIALYLMSKGARPTIFTFAMLGAFDVVKSMVEAFPGIQKTSGPHGISLLNHAYAGEEMKDSMTDAEINSLKQTIHFLEGLGDADGEKYIEVGSEEQAKYLGDYKYGSGEKDGFSIKLNMRKLLSLGPIGAFGGGLYKIAENKFIYNGAPSVTISFEIENEVVKSLTLVDPDLTITAGKVK